MSDDRSLIENYAGGAFGASLGFGTRRALLMVDFAAAYFEQASPLYAGVPRVREAAVRLLALARKAGVLVCHTRVEYDEAGLNGGVFYRKVPALSVFRKGSPLGEFAQGLEPAAGEPVITKQYASAFFGTSLDSLLRTQGVDCIMIAGMSTSGCVRATGVDAVQHGFIPIVVADACGDRHPAPHQASLFDLQAKYADVVTLEAVERVLAGGRTPS